MQHLSPSTWLLWDTSVILPYYVPELACNPKSLQRIPGILDAVRNHHLAAHCYIPNIAVAEVFAALDRACFSTWDRQTNGNFGGPGKALDKRKHNTARESFRRHIHNRVLFYQYELTRYHILGLDLITPIDKYRKHYRKGNVRSMGASDLLIGAMAMDRVRVHGRDNVFLVTTDRRMDAIFSQVPHSLNQPAVEYLGLDTASKKFGFGRWHPGLYPKMLDLARCSDPELGGALGTWPLPVRKKKGVPPRA